MFYNNSKVHQQDRLLDEPKAIELLKEVEYGLLSLVDKEKKAYGLPVNYVWNGKESIYLHCAPEGLKLDCIRHNNKVSFCIVGKTNALSEKFPTEYESIVIEFIAHINPGTEEKMNALLLLVDKYSTELKDKGIKYAEGSFSRREIIR
jgi:uncharacterized protein